MDSLVTIVARYARGARTSAPGASSQRRYASWTTSSASATLPNTRYAIENSSGRAEAKSVVRESIEITCSRQASTGVCDTLLFLHIIGALGLFAGIGLEQVSLAKLRRGHTVAQAREWVALLG